MSDIEFISGLVVKQPNTNAPSFVKAALSIKREELIAWLSARNDKWINADIKESRGGKWYVSVSPKRGGSDSTRQPERQSRQAPHSSFEDDSDLPF